MLTVIPNDAIMGATIAGLDLRRAMSDQEFAQVLRALGQYSVLRFADQHIDSFQLRDFSRRFGDIQETISKTVDPRHDCPEVGILSNVTADGKFIGIPDAGQDWHTDMSYRDMRGFVNVLYGIEVPRRDGRVLGGTEFSSMHAVYRALPENVKQRLAGATATHDFNKFWENMRQRHGSSRPALTAEQRALRPPVHHPILPVHPITGTKTLYCNPGYVTAIDGWDPAESASMLAYLFEFQLRPEFRYTHKWTKNDVLIWDNLGSIHQAIADYRPDEKRLMKRCQVLATEVFRPEFQRYIRLAA